MKKTNVVELAESLIAYKMRIEGEIEAQKSSIFEARRAGEDSGYLEEMCHYLRSLHDKLANAELLLKDLEN